MKQTFVTFYIRSYHFRLDLPSALVDLLAEEEVGAVGRRKVYGRLYSVWRICTGGRGKVVWPQVLREAVQKDSEEGPAGKYDNQHETCPSATHITLADIAAIDWSRRPPLPVPGSSKRKSSDGPGHGEKNKKIKINS
ncbi:hypothetical protein RRG08_026155 [Elysia crispata]|uniref:Uncharacterized protein n=1 Tax=Elysia crispata TaxID=231223 RepID=A0AAE0ZA48_9GAST|nr:hypothetical protein RRG08_026155 [Elysia crispata]